MIDEARDGAKAISEPRLWCNMQHTSGHFIKQVRLSLKKEPYQSMALKRSADRTKSMIGTVKPEKGAHMAAADGTEVFTSSEKSLTKTNWEPVQRFGQQEVSDPLKTLWRVDSITNACKHQDSKPLSSNPPTLQREKPCGICRLPSTIYYRPPNVDSRATSVTGQMMRWTG